MWLDQAAVEAQLAWSSLSSHFEDPIAWDEIKKNMEKGQINGSGHGYALLHRLWSTVIGMQFSFSCRRELTSTQLIQLDLLLCMSPFIAKTQQ